MGFICAICSAGLDKTPGINPGDVLPPQGPGASTLGTTPCGHVFHTFCITKWMGGGMANSNSCPCCRKVIPNRHCLPLFPDSYDDSLLDQSGSQSAEPSEAVINAIKEGYNTEILTLKRQLQAQKDETYTQSKLYELQCAEYHKLQNKFETEQARSETFMVKWKRYENYKEMYEEEVEKNKTLQEDIEHYNHVQAHLDVSNIEVEADLKIYSKCSVEEAIRKISGVKQMLQRELTSLKSKREADKSDRDRMCRDVATFRSKLAICHDKEKELQNLLDNLRDEVKRLRAAAAKGGDGSTGASTSKPKTTSQPSTSTSSSSSSPKGSKGTSSVRSTSSKSKITRDNLNRTILVGDSDESGDEIDGDVGLISMTIKAPPAPGKGSKPKAASMSVAPSGSKRPAVPVLATNNFLDDSDVIFCDDSDAEGGADKKNAPLSPIEMRIRSNIPGVPPINTPNPAAATGASASKKFTFKKQKLTAFALK